ncbi:MAG: hypothetical protein IIB33_03765 [Chloroflexi bacterium]|nr:hypothetical protein [Chloroflexota bacterium]
MPVFVTVVVGFLGDCNGSGGATQAEAVNIIDALAVALCHIQARRAAALPILEP